MNQLAGHAQKGTSQPEASQSIYKEIAQWIACHPDGMEARILREFMLSLSEASWSYSRAFDFTERMDKPSFELAMRALEQYSRTGACHELQRVCAELRSIATFGQLTTTSG